MLEKLAEGHDHIRHLMTELRALLDNGDASRIDQLTKMRVNYTRFFREHITADNELVCLMMKDKDLGVRQVARTYSERLAKLYPHLSCYIRLWPPENIVRDWHGYGAGARVLEARVYEQLEWEEKVMLPAARKMGCPRP